MTERARMRYARLVSTRGVGTRVGARHLAGCLCGGRPAFCFSDLEVTSALKSSTVEYNEAMSMTPKPSPVPSVYRVYLMGCDACGKYVEVKEDDTLPPAWRQVDVEGWCGSFHACSDECEERLHEKLTGGSP